MINRSQESGTAAGEERPRRPRTVQRENGIQRVVVDVQENPQTLISVRSAMLGLSTGSYTL